MLDKSKKVKYFKEIKGFKSLQVKAEAYLEPKQASRMFAKKCHHRCSM